MLTAKDQKKRAKQFIDITKGWKEEEQYKQKFWTLFLSLIFGETDVNYLVFEKPVDDVTSNTKRFIDVYIPSTKVIIEQKSWGHDLNEAWTQALNYNNNLPANEKANWIIVSDFDRIIVYDMTTAKFPSKTFYTKDLEKDYANFNFIVDSTILDLPDTSFDVSKRAGEIIAEIYNAVYDKYPVEIDEETKLQNLNKFCVRMVFCFYAEDAGLFAQKDQFYNYMRQFDAKDWRVRLQQLFQILNTPKDASERLFLDDDLKAFPYVNGGLFEGAIQLPQFTPETVDLILKTASGNFDWSQISPTIFGAMFESTLNPEIRKSGGMHYTSIENIHKVIDPLFLDELKERLEEIKGFSASQRTRALKEYQDYLASLKFLDPACGSGNFLTEAYICIRKLENEVLEILQNDQIVIDDFADVKVSIKQFYGIEINDFAVSVAMTALWIAESQMFEESQRILHGNKEFLPLTTNTNIHEGNALREDWNDIVSKNELNYIMGNPPFIGSSRTDSKNTQKEDMDSLFKEVKGAKKLDYVAGWYKKAALLMQNTKIKCAYVSTNSITQGEQVVLLWKPLIESLNLNIIFAYRSFQWKNEAKKQAGVSCVIVGFACYKTSDAKRIFNDVADYVIANHINGYLTDLPDFYIKSRGENINKSNFEIVQGNKPWPTEPFVFSAEERSSFINKYPEASDLVLPFFGSDEFLKGTERYCLWLYNVSPSRYTNIPEITSRLKAVKQSREETKTNAVQQQANTPYLFSQIRQPNCEYLAIPEVSTSSRKYIPLGFLESTTISSNKLFMIPNAPLWLFALLSSDAHMFWLKLVSGRLGNAYSYSPSVYNNFVWCNLTDDQKNKLENSAKAILEARILYTDCTLSDLYDDLTMPIELRKAHEENDKAVWEAYGKAWKFGNEAECVAYLMKLYEQKVQEK